MAVGEPGGEEVYKGAYAIAQALAEATQLNTLAPVSEAFEGGLCVARRACNMRNEVAVGTAYAKAAEEIRRCNDDHGRQKRLRTSASPAD